MPLKEKIKKHQEKKAAKEAEIKALEEQTKKAQNFSNAKKRVEGKPAPAVSKADDSDLKKLLETVNTLTERVTAFETADKLQKNTAIAKKELEKFKPKCVDTALKLIDLNSETPINKQVYELNKTKQFLFENSDFGAEKPKGLLPPKVDVKDAPLKINFI